MSLPAVPASAPLTIPGTPGAIVHLSTGGVSVVLDVTQGRLPAVVHWGASLGACTPADLAAIVEANIPPVVESVVDQPVRLALLPEPHTGWMGVPGIEGHRDGRSWSPRFTVTAVSVVPAATNDTPVDAHTADLDRGLDVDEATVFVTAGAAVVQVIAEDTVAGLTVAIDFEMLVSGLVRARAAVTNTAAGSYALERVSIALPVPGHAREILDFAGRWGKERTPQRRELVVGVHERDGRRGRTGADAATVLSVGTPGFGFRGGEVWGVHVAWSGNHRHYAERLSTGAQAIGGGELLLPGEIRLTQGARYTTPWLYGAYGLGLDDQAHRFHDWLRSRDTHPTRPRPVTLNVWEAVYFDHDLARLKDLADRAAAVGVERFVLDDGWFSGRRDDTAGLGDWTVDDDVWPDGLGPLVEHVRQLGMEFGLWFEPEMISERSTLATEHPDWIMRVDGRLPLTARNQQVLDLGNPDAYAHIRDAMSALIEEYRIDYVKWDHNRDLVDAGGADGAPGVHAQTHAAYRLMTELRERFPALEIESCSSGGARVDLGVIEHTDRVWASDCIDPLERQQINRWTMQLLPPELIGSHIASRVSHTTGRAHELSFRAGTALYGHLGIEWDLSTATDTETAALTAWIALYKTHRELMHRGQMVRVDQADDTQLVYGTVDEDRRSALFFFAVIGQSEISPRGRITFPGLDPDQHYRVSPVTISTGDDGLRPPQWWHAPSEVEPTNNGTVLTGRALAVAGVQAPATFPDRVVLFSITAE